MIISFSLFETLLKVGLKLQDNGDILMKKNKKLTEYFQKYGNVPNDYYERFTYLISEMKLNMKDIDKIKKSIKRILGIQYEEISFVFYFFPQATPRPRYSRFTKAFYVKNALDYNTLFKEFMESCNDLNFKIITPCELICKTYSPIPSTMNKVDSILAELGLIKHISKPDGDNLLKSYSDMIQKNLVIDDALFYKMDIEKLYSFKPRIEITVRYMIDYDSKYNEKKISKYKNN